MAKDAQSQDVSARYECFEKKGKKVEYYHAFREKDILPIGQHSEQALEAAGG